MNDEGSYNNGRLEQNNKEEFEEELRRIEKTTNDNDEDDMNVDRII